MNHWLRTILRRPDDHPETGATLKAMRDTRRIAEDLAAGRSVPKRRFVEVELRLTGNVVEDHLTGAARNGHTYRSRP